MFDLSPEKLIVLMALGLMVLGPQRLPGAARTLATGLARARRMAETFTEPVHAALQEPRQAVETAMGEIHGALRAPVPGALGTPGTGAPSGTATTSGAGTLAGTGAPSGTGAPVDPTLN